MGYISAELRPIIQEKEEKIALQAKEVDALKNQIDSLSKQLEELKILVAHKN